MADAANRVDEQVEQWRNDLVDLTRRNRLLNVRPGARSSDLLVVEPGAEEILARLLGGSGRQAEWRFHYPPLDSETLADPVLAAALESEDTELTPEREPDELLTELTSARTLSAKLHTLERKAGQEFLDKGLRVLYLGVGMLQWTDLDGTPMQSPLVMVPVTLSRRSPRDPYRLAGTEDDLALNPALAVKLETDFGVELPGLDDPANALAVLDTVARSVGGQAGWRVTRGAVLGAFSFHKEAMYRDLEHNHATVVAHVLVRALSGEQVDPGALELDPVADADLDETVPPELMASILDADSTQRRCIAAARDGRSFVMDGPPGTGKSQTIANMISELLVAGKTVLFVSEKAAALEVVKNRLDRAGLGSFVLELHSHKATRKELAKALGVALGERVRATSELADSDLARAERLRRELSAYAIAQNEVRDPLGISLHAAIGRRAVLDAELAVPIPSSIDSGFTAADHEAVTALAHRLAGAWGPVSGRASFLWRDLADPAGAQQRITAMGIDLGAALDTLGSLREIAGAVTAQLRLPPPPDDAAADRLTAIVARLDSRPTAPTNWLTVADPAPLLARVHELETMIAAHRAAVAYLDSWGGTWQGLEPGHELILDQRVAALRAGPAPIDLAPATPAASVRSTAEYLEWLVAEAPALLATADPLADQLGLERGRVPAELAVLASIGRCAAAPSRPDAGWFADPALAAARAAARSLRPVIEQNRALEADLAAMFTPAVYQLDIESFYDGPQDLVPQLGRLSGKGRANRRQLKACVPDGDLSDDAVAALPLVRRWHQTQAELVATETTHAAALGSWYRRADTDFGAIDAALDLAAQIVALLGGDPVPAGLIDQLRAEGPVADRLVADSDALAARVDQWTRSLVHRPHLPGPTLSGWAVDDVARWAADSLPAVRALGAELDAIHTVAARELTIDTARQFGAPFHNANVAHVMWEAAGEDQQWRWSTATVGSWWAAHGFAGSLARLGDGLRRVTHGPILYALLAAAAVAVAVRRHRRDAFPPAATSPAPSATSAYVAVAVALTAAWLPAFSWYVPIANGRRYLFPGVAVAVPALVALFDAGVVGLAPRLVERVTRAAAGLVRACGHPAAVAAAALALGAVEIREAARPPTVGPRVPFDAATLATAARLRALPAGTRILAGPAATVPSPWLVSDRRDYVHLPPDVGPAEAAAWVRAHADVVLLSDNLRTRRAAVFGAWARPDPAGGGLAPADVPAWAEPLAGAPTTGPHLLFTVRR